MQRCKEAGRNDRLPGNGSNKADSATYTVPSGSPVDVGLSEDPGYTLSYTPEMESINNTDAFAANVIEQIYLGLSQVALKFIAKEAGKAAAVNAAQPFSTFGPTGAQTFSSGLVGRRATDLAGSVVMSATASTPAAATPASMTFLYAMLHEGTPVDQVFGPRHRKIPINWRIVANGTTTANYFTAT